jgi:hypothetical protein
MRYKPQQCRVIDTTEGQMVLQRQKKKYRAPVALETELLAVRSTQLLHAQASAQLQEQELQQHPALSAHSNPAGTPAHYAGQLLSAWPQAAAHPDHSMEDMQQQQAQPPLSSTTPSLATAVQQPLPALPGGLACAGPARASSMHDPNSPAAVRTSWNSPAQPAYMGDTDDFRLRAGYAQDTKASHTTALAAMQQQQHSPASPLLSPVRLHHAAAPDSGLGAVKPLASLALGGQLMPEDSAAAAAAFMAGMHLQELGQGTAMARAKNSRSRDGSEEQQEGVDGLGGDAAVAKSPKLWHSQTASTVEQQREQQQPFLLW